MILIVDDDPSVTASLALLLKQAGYASHSVAGPEAALAWLARERCELVIQDMNFSRRTTGEEGLDLLARIKSAAPSLPVILITAWGSIGLAVEGMKSGAADFVTKPWTNQQILQTVQTALRSRRQPPCRCRRRPAYPRGPRRALRLRHARRTRPAPAAHPAADRTRGADRCVGADHRRERHRQGAGRGRHPPQQPPRAGPVREGEPGRHLRLALRERDVRARERRVHRCPRGSQGPLRGGTRRDDLPRRDRRPRRRRPR